MKTAAIAALLSVAVAAEAAAQDRIILKDTTKAPIDANLHSITWKDVTYEPFDTPGSQLTIESRRVREFQFDFNNKQGDYANAERLMNSSEFEEAATRFVRAATDTRLSAPVRDTARFMVVRCWLAAGKQGKAIDAARALRAESKDSFYLEPSFQLQYEAAMDAGDLAAAQKAAEEFAQAGQEKGEPAFAKAAELQKAQVLEAKGDFRVAGDIYRKLANEKEEAGLLARLGQLRCLAGMKEWGQLKMQAESIVSKTKSEDGPDAARLLMGARVGLGQALLYGDDKPYEALKEFRRADIVLAGKSPDATVELQASLAHGAVAAARHAKKQSDPEQKQQWAWRAQELLAELKQRFGDTPLAKMAAGELKTALGGK